MHEFKGKINNLLAKLAILMLTLKGFSNALCFVHNCIPLCYILPGIWYFSNTTFSFLFLHFGIYCRHWMLSLDNQEKQ